MDKKEILTEKRIREIVREEIAKDHQELLESLLDFRKRINVTNYESTLNTR